MAKLIEKLQARTKEEFEEVALQAVRLNQSGLAPLEIPQAVEEIERNFARRYTGFICTLLQEKGVDLSPAMRALKKAGVEFGE